jgi:hypothetical protein
MLEKNTLTFNPGWDRAGNTLPDFDDVRDIQESLKGQGLFLVMQADESSTSPASLVGPGCKPHVHRSTCATSQEVGSCLKSGVALVGHIGQRNQLRRVGPTRAGDLGLRAEVDSTEA